MKSRCSVLYLWYSKGFSLWNHKGAVMTVQKRGHPHTSLSLYVKRLRVQYVTGSISTDPQQATRCQLTCQGSSSLFLSIIPRFCPLFYVHVFFLFFSFNLCPKNSHYFFLERSVPFFECQGNESEIPLIFNTHAQVSYYT